MNYNDGEESSWPSGRGGRHRPGPQLPYSYREQESGEDEIDLRQLAWLFWARKWLIAYFIAAGLILVIAAIYRTTPIYRSSGTIMISESQNRYLYAGSDMNNLLFSSFGIGIGSSLNDELGILQSRSLSLAVADTLLEAHGQRSKLEGLGYPILFTDYPSDSAVAERKVIAARLRNTLQFSQLNHRSRLVEIAYESPSAQEAADVVNSTIAMYNVFSTRQNRKAAKAAVTFLERELTSIEGRLSRAELQLQQYMDEKELVQVDAQTQSLIERLALLQQQRQEARTGQVTVDSAIEEYEAQLNSIRPGLADQFADALGPNMTRLQYQLAELKIERMQLLSENPQLRNTTNPPGQLRTINRQIRDYEDEIRHLTAQLLDNNEQYLGFMGGGGVSIAQNIAELNKTLIALRVEQQQYRAQDQALTEEIDQLDRTFSDLPEEMIGLARLRRSVSINEALYISVSEKYAEMELWQQTQFGQGQLVDEAFVPEKPVKPNKPLYLLVGLLLGGIAGVGYVLAREGFNTTIDGSKKLKELGKPVLAVVPDIGRYISDHYDGDLFTNVRKRMISTSLVSLLNTVSPITEAFRRLEANVLHADPDKSISSLLVTSTRKGEGKSTVIANLGVIMAEVEQKILLVDTDMHRSNLHTLFGLERSPGIVDVLFDNVRLEEAIKPTVVPNLFVLPAGYRPPNPSSVIKSDRFSGLVRSLKESYDRVLIDSPPYGIITDSSSLMDQVDGVAVVCRFGEIHTGELQHTLENLSAVDAHIIGMVLNGYIAEKSSDYYYGHTYYKDFYAEYAAYEAER